MYHVVPRSKRIDVGIEENHETQTLVAFQEMPPQGHGHYGCCHQPAKVAATRSRRVESHKGHDRKDDGASKVGLRHDKDKAEAYFKKSLAINPDGIDPHFFYGEYLLDRGRHAEAREHLENALKAPARSGRELADNGRRKEVQALLEKLNKETK